MSKATELVKAIGEKVIDELNGFDDYDIEFDEGDLYSASISANFGYEYGNSGCDIECNVSWPGGDIEVNIYGCEGIHEKRYKMLDRLEEAVSGYVDEHLDTDDLLSCIKDKYRNDSADEWEDHGFRDAADYYSWRYGR